MRQRARATLRRTPRSAPMGHSCNSRGYGRFAKARRGVPALAWAWLSEALRSLRGAALLGAALRGAALRDAALRVAALLAGRGAPCGSRRSASLLAGPCGSRRCAARREGQKGEPRKEIRGREYQNGRGRRRLAGPVDATRCFCSWPRPAAGPPSHDKNAVTLGPHPLLGPSSPCS